MIIGFVEIPNTTKVSHINGAVLLKPPHPYGNDNYTRIPVGQCIESVGGNHSVTPPMLKTVDIGNGNLMSEYTWAIVNGYAYPFTVKQYHQSEGVSEYILPNSVKAVTSSVMGITGDYVSPIAAFISEYQNEVPALVEVIGDMCTSAIPYTKSVLDIEDSIQQISECISSMSDMLDIRYFFDVSKTQWIGEMLSRIVATAAKYNKTPPNVAKLNELSYGVPLSRMLKTVMAPDRVFSEYTNVSTPLDVTEYTHLDNRAVYQSLSKLSATDVDVSIDVDILTRVATTISSIIYNRYNFAMVMTQSLVDRDSVILKYIALVLSKVVDTIATKVNVRIQKSYAGNVYITIVDHSTSTVIGAFYLNMNMWYLANTTATTVVGV